MNNFVRSKFIKKKKKICLLYKYIQNYKIKYVYEYPFSQTNS